MCMHHLYTQHAEMCWSLHSYINNLECIMNVQYAKKHGCHIKISHINYQNCNDLNYCAWGNRTIDQYCSWQTWFWAMAWTWPLLWLHGLTIRVVLKWLIHQQNIQKCQNIRMQHFKGRLDCSRNNPTDHYTTSPFPVAEVCRSGDIF